MKKSLLSIITPCYCEEKSIPIFYNEITKVAEDMDYLDFEFLFIDDGSSDNTINVIKKLRNRDERVKYISFSRNFGKESAIYAGLEATHGDYIAVMDVDLQDPPALLKEMYKAVSEDGWDCAATRRVTRKGEPPIRSYFANKFYQLIKKISNTEIVDGARDFRLFTRKMADAILKLKEYNRFSKGLFGWVGFKTKWLEYENIERAAGETKWSFWKLFAYAIEGIVAFSTVPLMISTIVGFIFCILSFTLIVVIIAKTLIWGDPVSGWPSLACIIFLVGGVNLFCMGILGEYLSKTYLETKNRPIYLVKEAYLTQNAQSELINSDNISMKKVVGRR